MSIASPTSAHPWELGENVVMAASAGTGKTYNLVGVLLYAMLLGPTPLEPSRILATTFSKRAAEEIRERVTHEIALLAEGVTGSRYGTLFRGAKAHKRAKDLTQRSHQLRITTLHAFAVELLRTHGMHIAIAPDFTLLDPQEEFQRVELVTSDTLEYFARLRPDDLLTAITAAGGLGELTSFVASTLRAAPERARDLTKLVPADDAALLEAQFMRVIDAARDLSVDSTRFGPAAKTLVSAWDSAAEPTAIEQALGALFDIALSKKKSPSEEAWAELVDSLAGENKAIKAHILFESYMRRHEFAKTGGLFREILAHAETALATRARERQELSFGDVLVFARALLRDHPSLALQVGAEFDACLLDEAQDTSPVQRDIVLLLWQNPAFVRAPGEPAGLAHIRPRGLFVVGDRKQSIYGFRGADVAIFAEFALGIAGAPARDALGIPSGLLWEPETPTGRFLTLRENYRGNGQLLAAANALSAAIFVPSEPSETFDVHYVPRADDLSLPEARRADVTEATVEPLRVAWLGLKQPGEDADDSAQELYRSLTGPRRDAEIIARKVAELTRTRPRRDIAVLARSNSMLDHIAFALAQANIPYVASGRAFFAAREIQDAAAFLALLRDPSSALAAAQVLRGPYTGLSDLSLLDLTQDRGLLPILDVPPEQISDDADRKRFSRTQTCVRRLTSLADRLGPADLLREGIRALHVEDVLYGLRNGDQRVSNLRKFEQWLAKFRHLSTACMRIELARTMSEAEAPTFSDADDAIRLLTIHGSKGLSFPVVLLPELAKRASPFSPGAALFLDDATLGTRLRSSRGYWMESTRTKATTRREVARQKADAQRVWYVAITRAEGEMYFAGGDDKVAPAGSLLELLPSLVAAGLAAREDLALATPAASEPSVAVTSEPPATAKVPAPRRLALAPTALADFIYCPRRFALANVWRVTEGRPLFAVDEAPVDPRARGTALHKVLEHVDDKTFGETTETAAAAVSAVYTRLFAQPTEGETDEARDTVVAQVAAFLSSDYAKQLNQARASIFREVPFRVSHKRGEFASSLRGTIDMIARYEDGSVDVIDYKSGKGPSLAPYSVQLRIYARAARELFPDATNVRAYAVFLGGSCVPVPLDAAPFTDDEWVASVAQLVKAQAQTNYPRVELPRCREIRCGYVPRCHGERA